MNCPNCDHNKHRCLVVRHDTNETTMRRRRCLNCKHVWFTVEVDIPREAIVWGDKGSISRRPGFRRIDFQ